MMYDFWDMEYDGHNFLLFWTVFCPFTPLWTKKIKLLKKRKKHLEILSSYKIVPWMAIIRCMVPETWSATGRIFCHFGPFLALLPKNKNFQKMKKTPVDIIILHMCTINDNHIMYGSCDIERDRQSFLSFWAVFALLAPYGPENQIFEKMKRHLAILPFYKCGP